MNHDGNPSREGDPQNTENGGRCAWRGIAALTGMLAILSLLAVLTAGDANRMPRKSVLTPDSPSYPVVCHPATEADRSRLPTPADPDDRHWTCSLLCFAPMSVTKTAGLLVEREDEDPLLFLDLNQSGRFTPESASFCPGRTT